MLTVTESRGETRRAAASLTVESRPACLLFNPKDMHTFRVWAPKPEKVQLFLNGQTLEMECGQDGWRHIRTDAKAGDRYGFVLDGGKPLPDPKSPYQPDGVHELSQVVDHAAFEWTDQNWQAPPLTTGLIYELHVGTFTPEGTFDSAIAKLDHLKQLGVTHVELLPVCAFPGRWGWGYDGVSLFSPHRAYGGPEGLKRLVNAAHEKGLAMVLDVVYNHLGPSGNYLSLFGPYFTTHHKTPWGEAVNLDGPHSHQVRRFFCDNALMWLRDYHFDGLRIDAVHALIDYGAIHFLEQLAVEVDQLSTEKGRHLVLIAESDLNDPRVVRTREAGGYGLQAQWSDDFHHALHSVLTGETAGYYSDYGEMAHLVKALRSGFVHDGSYSPYRRRPHGRPLGDLPGTKLLGYSQNHDQVGNRAAGERLVHLVGHDRAKIAAALTLTAPFIPMLFQGEEWAASSPFQYFTDHEDPELGKAVSEGRRSEFVDFGWQPEAVPDPQDTGTFERSKLNWEELERDPHRDMLEWYRSLIRLRLSRYSVRNGDLRGMDVQFSEEERWMLITRNNRMRIAVNLGEEPHTFQLPEGLQLLMASSADVQLNGKELRVGPDQVAIAGPPPETL